MDPEREGREQDRRPQHQQDRARTYIEQVGASDQDHRRRDVEAREAIVERAVTQSATFGPELWPRVTRWDAGQMDAAFAALHAPVLAIQSTTRNAQLQRSPMKPGDTNPYLETVKAYGAKVEIVPDTGHFTQLEAPERVNQLIARFTQA